MKLFHDIYLVADLLIVESTHPILGTLVSIEIEIVIKETNSHFIIVM
jgi:hypothetical protein